MTTSIRLVHIIVFFVEKVNHKTQENPFFEAYSDVRHGTPDGPEYYLSVNVVSSEIHQ